MRRYTFYLLVALLAFGIGSFVGFKFYFQLTEQPLIVDKVDTVENSSEIETVSKEIKYGCEEKELEAFWEKLDKEFFFKFAKAQLKENYKHYPDIYELEWEHLNQRFHCSSFTNLEKKDLNNDGIEEVFVRDNDYSLRDDSSLYVFREINDKWQIILFDLTTDEIEITKRKYGSFPQITVKSGHYRSGESRINSFQFNGKFYESRKLYIKVGVD